MLLRTTIRGLTDVVGSELGGTVEPLWNGSGLGGTVGPAGNGASVGPDEEPTCWSRNSVRAGVGNRQPEPRQVRNCVSRSSRAACSLVDSCRNLFSNCHGSVV